MTQLLQTPTEYDARIDRLRDAMVEAAKADPTILDDWEKAARVDAQVRCTRLQRLVAWKEAKAACV